VGTFHVPFTRNADKTLDSKGTEERANELCRLCQDNPTDRNSSGEWVGLLHHVLPHPSEDTE
jgi:hypothetical protein